MRDRSGQVIAAVALGVCCGGLMSACVSSSSAPETAAPAAQAGAAADTGPDNEELKAIFTADQADRLPGTAPSDWHVVEQRDRSRQVRVRELLDAGAVRTARDYYHAGMVYQHADDADGVQLAHELAMIGACMGDKNARWLAAASYDRLMMDLKRPQRFGTQYRSDDQGVTKLYVVSKGVTDSMRAAMRVPSLGEAEAREKEMQAQLEELRKAMKENAEK